MWNSGYLVGGWLELFCRNRFVGDKELVSGVLFMKR